MARRSREVTGKLGARRPELGTPADVTGNGKTGSAPAGDGWTATRVRTNVRMVSTKTFVALDIETTGLDPEQDRVTEVGAVRFDANGEELETFSALVNPGRTIPVFIEQLTGISNEAVRSAPALDVVAPALTAFVGAGPLVGQNLRFDVGHLGRAGVTLRAPRFDTKDLARMLLPAGPRGLADLARELGVELTEHHRALPDARSAARVFVALLKKARELDAGTRLQLARFVSMENPELAEVLAGEDWADVPISERHLPSVRPAPEYPALVKREPRTPIAVKDVDAVFRAAERTFERFEERPQQRQMAAAVREAMADGGHWLIEAGTGVGKSLAYLVPAALHALRNGERVVISTNTINLQEQLFTKDIPALRRMLRAAGVIGEEADLRASLLKGRGNYLCLRRFMASYGAIADPDYARLGASMLLWLPRTETGDRSELRLDPADWSTWQRFSAQDADCLARQNPYVREGKCFLQRARKSAESAHLLIVNHALLLADVASGGNALPPFDHLIIDEAHNLEDQATQQFGGSVSRRVLAEALEALHRRGGPQQREGGVATLLRAFPDGSAVKMAGEALEVAVATAHAKALPAFEALARHTRSTGEDERTLLDRSLRAQPAWAEAEQAWSELDRALADAITKAVYAAKLVTDTAMVEEPDAIAAEVESAARKVEELRALLEHLMGTVDDETVVWIGRERDGTGSLNSAPLDVGPALWEHLFEKRRTVVATSATLAANGSMEFAARRLGLEAPRTLQLGSPFDYEASTLLAAFTDVPEPNDPGYHDAVAAAIVELVRASEGRALALFTSNAALRKAADLVRAELEGDGIAVLAQGVDGSPRQLTENLVQKPRALVLGTTSFWEGVDIRGDALSLLIIARLPFAVPTDPVHRARGEQYESPFAQYSLPAAILKFRQGFGRLIRDRDDRGVVAVLDRRIFEKRYGSEFVNSLPACTRIKANADVVALRTREWLAE